MGWISIVKLGKGVSKVKVPKVRFDFASLGTRFSTWIQGTKFSSWLKAGLAGGVGYTVYHAWGSGISSLADATGLPESTVESLLFAGIGIMIAYIAARLLIPEGGSTVVVKTDSDGTRTRTVTRAPSKSSGRRR